MFEQMPTSEYFKMNAKLQQKKNKLRKALKEKGVLERKGKNKYDDYKYFSEAQYKELFTELLADSDLELRFTELDYTCFEGTAKMNNGRMPKLKFSLIDCETGFYEDTEITGEAMDKGDKAGYKAYTGALKYYLANTFMVATGDDVEKESPDEKANTKVEKPERKASPKQISMLKGYYTGDNLTKLLEANQIEKIEDLSIRKASELISKIKEAQKNG